MRALWSSDARESSSLIDDEQLALTEEAILELRFIYFNYTKGGRGWFPLPIVPYPV